MSRRPIVIKKSSKPFKDHSAKFTQVFEQCGEQIMNFLTSKDHANLKGTCRVAFYHVESLQVWGLMMVDNDKPDVLSQISTKEDSQISDSFLKNSFCLKSSTRPQTEQKTRKINTQIQQWFPRPQSGKQQKQYKFLTQKNVIEETHMSIEDQLILIDTWIFNIKKAEKLLKMDSIETDSLIQEITLWNDHLKILTDIKSELELKETNAIIQQFQIRSYNDITFGKKCTVLNKLITNIFDNYKVKQEFIAQMFSLKQPFQQFLNTKLGDFSNCGILVNLDSLIQNQSYLKIFAIRSNHLYSKIFQILLQLVDPNLSWTVDFQNYETKLNLLENLTRETKLIQKQHSITLPMMESITFNNGKKFQQSLTNHIKIFSDLQKMLKLNKKLIDKDNSLAIQSIFNKYKKNQFNNFTDNMKWTEIYDIWKSEYQNKQVIEEKQEINTGFGFFQKQMNWTVS